jgi:subtilisin
MKKRGDRRMKYIKVLVLTVLLISLTTPSTVKAEETEYYILTENFQKMISFMNKDGMKVLDTYSAFSTVHASLNESEINKLRKMEPSLTIQQDKHYKAAVDTVRSTQTKINAQPLNSSPYTGKQVKVGILDSGIDTEHRDLKVIDGFCSLAPDCSTGVPFDDNNGHGTHVAGIIAALANGTGLIGIAPNVDLYSIKVLDDLGAGTTSSIVQGIEWAINQKLDIINLSITSTTDDPLIKKALEVAYSKGLIIVGAAGNQGKDTTDTVTYPAKYDSVIAVGAVNEDLTSFKVSSQGPQVEIVAPGSSIFSTYPTEWDFVDGKQDGYRTQSGTSMSSPHVTGVLALLKERFPSMTNVEIRNLLGGMTIDLGDPGRDPIFGKGFLQYPKLIPGAPEIIKQSSSGKVDISLKEPDDSVSIWRDGIKLPKTNNSWSIYGVKGTYSIDIGYTTTNAIPVKERMNILLSEPNYIDVTASQWFSPHIGYLANKKQIAGYSDGTFKPYQVITRAEAATLIGRALKFDGTQTDTVFKDVAKESFASGYIQKAVEANIITGYDDGTFNPNKTVTRAELAILIAKAFKLPTSVSSQNTFTDVSPSMAAYAYILPTIDAKVTKGYSDGTFRPYKTMTRSEFAAFLTRVQTDEIQ